jgi:hypothetical protein
MSNLDLIRSLRRAMTELRDAQNPAAVEDLARALANELDAKLGQLQLVESGRTATVPAEAERQPVDLELFREVGMAVYA